MWNMEDTRGGNDCALPFTNGHSNSCTCGSPSMCYTSIQIDPLNARVLNEILTVDLIPNASTHSYVGPSNNRITDSRRTRIRTTSSSSDNVIDKNIVSQYVIIVPFALTVISLLFGIFSAVMFLQLSSKYDQLKGNLSYTEASVAYIQQQPTLCLPCEEITQGPCEQDNLALEQLEQKQENGVHVCCAKTTEQTTVLLKLFAKRKYMQKCVEDVFKENKTGEGCASSSEVTHAPANGTGKISAYLQAGIQTNFGNLTGDEPIRNWLYDQPGTHLLGIELTNGRFVIPKTGHYFVYSQVGFVINYANGDENFERVSQSIFHKVKRFNELYPRQEEELLRSTVTQCWEKNKEYGRYTSYVGAAVSLNKTDMIYVTVSRVRDLSREFTHTYFGLFSMS